MQQLLQLPNAKRAIRNVLTSDAYKFNANDFTLSYDGNRNVTVHCINGTTACNNLQKLNLNDVSNLSIRNCDASKVVADMSNSANGNTKEGIAITAILASIGTLAIAG